MNLAKLLLCTIVITSCGQFNKSKPIEPMQSDVIQSDISRLIVSFYSKGSGIDSKSKDLYLNYLDSIAKQDGLKLNYTAISWGKEGEVNFCFMLNEYNSEKQIDFINDSKLILKEGRNIHFYENQPCI